jgi:hypothetical protein
MTVMNIARHFHRAEKSAYDPESRERRVEVEAPAGIEMDAGKWTAAEGGSARTATSQGSPLSVKFTGNRIELIGWRDPSGGTADVWIDGKPAADIDAFYVGYIQPDKQNAPLPPNPPRDRCPHAASLGTNIVPQSWTMTMTSDTGDYELVGSVTGPDGKGNGLQPFTSKSGQIVVDPAFWRDAKNNRSGDRFTFEVLRVLQPPEAFFWATHNGAELDLLFLRRSRRYGVEIKFQEAPAATKSMRVALDDLRLEHLWVVFPGAQSFPIDQRITAWPLRDIARLPDAIRLPEA